MGVEVSAVGQHIILVYQGLALRHPLENLGYYPCPEVGRALPPLRQHSPLQVCIMRPDSRALSAPLRQLDGPEGILHISR
jgi:hypothetical protein